MGGLIGEDGCECESESESEPESGDDDEDEEADEEDEEEEDEEPVEGVAKSLIVEGASTSVTGVSFPESSPSSGTAG